MKGEHDLRGIGSNKTCFSRETIGEKDGNSGGCESLERLWGIKLERDDPGHDREDDQEDGWEDDP